MFRMLMVLCGIAVAQLQPTFKSGVEVLAVDVHVVDKKGTPVRDLLATDFEVVVGGQRRRVLSADLIDYGSARSTATAAATSSAPGVAGGPNPPRLFVLAVDEHSLHPGNAMAAVRAAERFISRLEPTDFVSVYAYPSGVVQDDFTNDHAAAKKRLGKVMGLYSEGANRFNLSPSEALDIANGNRDAIARVLRRECASPAIGCSGATIQAEATGLAAQMEMAVSQSLGGLRALVRDLRTVPGTKTLVIVSGGLALTDEIGGRLNSRGEIQELAREAALANLSVFALHLDWSFISAQSARGGMRTTVFRDGDLGANGLDRLAGATGGTVVRVYGTAPERAFDRVLLETSARYVLGVETDVSDRPGETRAIQVKVKRGGLQVRSRTFFVVPSRK